MWEREWAGVGWGAGRARDGAVEESIGRAYEPAAATEVLVEKPAGARFSVKTSVAAGWLAWGIKQLVGGVREPAHSQKI